VLSGPAGRPIEVRTIDSSMTHQEAMAVWQDVMADGP